MYFKPVCASTESELKFNKIKYYHDDSDFTPDNELSSYALLSELNTYPENGSQFISQFWTMVEHDQQDQFLPAYIPLLDDMDAYLHKGVSVFMKWFCYNVEDMDPLFIPDDLVPIFDMKIIMSPDEIPIFSVPSDPREVVLGSNMFGVHVLEDDDMITHVHLNVLSSVATLSQNRFYSVCISSQRITGSLKIRCFKKGSKLVIWNARSIHRPSFDENFAILFEPYSPMVVVLTEARVNKPFVYLIRKVLGEDYFIEVIGPDNGLGGLLVIWDRRAIPYIHMKQQTLLGHVLSTTITPSWQPSVISMNEDDLTTHAEEDEGIDWD